MKLQPSAMNNHNFTAKDSEIYLISADEFGEEITVFKDGESLGHISLERISDEGPDNEIFYVTHLSLENCRRLGIGRACLQLHHRTFGRPITAGVDNGTTSGDGSHLTGDGLPFVTKMREEGLIVSDEELDDSDCW